MTKQEEMQILRDAVTKLGTNSYLGPWLSSVLGEVEDNILNDFEPVPTVQGTMDKVARMLKEAEEKCQALKEDTVAKTTVAINVAHNRIEQLKQEARQALLVAADKLDR